MWVIKPGDAEPLLVDDATLPYWRSLGYAEWEPDGGGSVPSTDAAKEQYVPSRLSDASLKAAYGRLRPPTFVGLGDSITSNGGRVWNDASAPESVVNGYSWHFWGQLLADSRVLWSGNFGAPSQTPAQIRDTYLPYLLAKDPAPTYCVLLAGQNDPSQLTAYTDIVDALIAAGVTPILCTLTPTSPDRQYLVMNAHIRLLAQAHGLPLVDLHAALVDEATGAWRAGLNRDAVHPTPLGARVMGEALADALTSLVPVNVLESWLPRTEQGYGGGRAAGGQDQSYVLQSANYSETYPDIPANRDVLAGYYAGSGTLTTPGPPVVGRLWTVTTNADNQSLITRYFAVTDALVGDQMLFVARVSASVEAAGGTWGVGAINGDGTGIYDVGRNSSPRLAGDVPGSILALPFTAIGSTCVVDMTVADAPGASIGIAQSVVYNLTGLGVA